MFGGLAAMLIIAGIAAGGRLLPRLESDIGSDARWALFQDTFDMIRARPLLGHGAGTFAEAFPLFHTRAPSDYIWLEAHNSYLQAMAEIGIPVFTVVMVGAGIVLAYIVRGVTRGTGPMPVAVAAVSAAAGVAAQSLVDFTIQIQAIGLTLFILVGAGLGEIASRSARLSSEK
jgi:O-antigen ligase